MVYTFICMMNWFTNPAHVKFEATARQKWMDACKEVGLKCNTHGLHLTTDFEPHYIAKDETKKEESKKTAFELAAFDTKPKVKTKHSFNCLTPQAGAISKRAMIT